MSRRLGSGEPRFNVASAVDDLRRLVARADALVHATEDRFERFVWDGVDNGPSDEDGRNLEHLAHLMGASKEAIRAAVHTGDQLAADLVKHRVRT